MAEPRWKTRATVRRIISKTKLALTVQPTQPAFPDPPEITPRTLFTRHLDGVDEHRCNRCHVAFAEGAPLCKEGAKLHRAYRKWKKENGEK